MAVIFITHDLASVARIADRVAVVYAGEIVEQAPVRDIYRTPRHPYTSGLLGAIPSLASARLTRIEGEAPNLLDVDRKGCSFAPRCDFALDLCRTTSSPEVKMGETVVLCHRAEELALPGVKR